jgi:hypothetical protein
MVKGSILHVEWHYWTIPEALQPSHSHVGFPSAQEVPTVRLARGCCGSATANAEDHWKRPHKRLGLRGEPGSLGIHGEKGGATEAAIHRKHDGTLPRPRTRLRNGNGIAEMARPNRNRAFFSLHLLDRIKCGRDVTPPVRQAHFAVKNQMLEFRTSGSVE